MQYLVRSIRLEGSIKNVETRSHRFLIIGSLSRRGYGMAAAAIFLVLCASVWQIYRYFNPTSISDAARDIRIAFLNGDARALYAMAPAHERAILRLTNAQLDTLSEKFFRPRVRGITVVKTLGHDVSRARGQGLEHIRLRLPSGRIVDYAFQALVTDEGHRNRFSAAIADAWYLTYIDKHPNVMDSRARLASFQAGIENDRVLLESVGVPGVVGEGLDGKLSRWDAMSDRLAKLAERLRG